jgi:hypothetical protein
MTAALGKGSDDMVSTTVTSADLPLPSLRNSVVVVPPPASEAGSWAGAPTAYVADGLVYLAYRLRRPIGAGRGYRNVVAVSEDGVSFRELCAIDREQFGAESLERPAITRGTDGRWRLYVSCATPDSKHWRVDVLEAASVADLAGASPTTVLPGSADAGVKDPVIVLHEDRWHLWASVHPLERWDDADRMSIDYATSDDGLAWTWHGTVLRGRPGTWDARGVRPAAAVVKGDELLMAYDGRASADENWEERTGLAAGSWTGNGFGNLQSTSDEPLGSGLAGGGLRYLSVVETSRGTRLYYEYTRGDGAHELRTELVGGGRQSQR